MSLRLGDEEGNGDAQVMWTVFDRPGVRIGWAVANAAERAAGMCRMQRIGSSQWERVTIWSTLCPAERLEVVTERLNNLSWTQINKLSRWGIWNADNCPSCKATNIVATNDANGCAGCGHLYVANRPLPRGEARRRQDNASWGL